ncbi:MAG: UPF0175 family protein [Candidatus Diapherotrites archaeon]|nr:UPF0175 family protein [Candidatus Diapherotrites archaeon]
MKTTSVRLEEPEAVTAFQKVLKEKKSGVLRELIVEGRKAKSVELFRQKKVSLGLGAKLAGLTVSEYFDLLEKNMVPLNLSRREAQKALDTARKVL